MHRPLPGLGPVYKRHTGQHHRVFTREAMPVESWRDLRALLVSPVLVVFFVGGLVTPVWFRREALVSANVAWLFAASGVACDHNDKVPHTADHRPDKHWLAHIGRVGRLRGLHPAQHAPRRMAGRNVNITDSPGDRLSGTLCRRRDAASPPAP